MFLLHGILDLSRTRDRVSVCVRVSLLLGALSTVQVVPNFGCDTRDRVSILGGVVGMWRVCEV